MSKTIEAVKPTAKQGNATKSTKVQAIASYLQQGKKGANVVSPNLPANVTGKQVERVKRQLSALTSAKIEANKDHKAHIYGFKFNLDSFKTRGTKYLAEFNAKHNLKVQMANVMTLTPQMLAPFMSDKQKEQKANNGNKWSFWDIETLVAKYFAPVKVAKVKKAK